ncbi:unnamed protein product, partial [Polarella glacialis]
AAQLAGRLGRSLGTGDVGASPPVPAVPVYFYGAAREDRRPLAALRRSLGYFGGAVKGAWSGVSAEMRAGTASLKPDCGPCGEVDDKTGVVCLGAVPWVHNYNILVTAGDILEAELQARCRRIARATSARGGGLASVEAMALPHERGVE